VRSIKLLLVLFISCAALPLFGQVSDEQIVANGFPSYLTKHGNPCALSKFIEADLNRDGHPLVVASYSNCVRAAVRVFDKGGQLIGEAKDFGLTGRPSSIRAVDLDGDGVPELIVELGQGKGIDNPDTWIFAWSDRQLRVISPTCKQGSVSFSCLRHVDVLSYADTARLGLLAWPSFKKDPKSNGVVQVGDWTLYGLQNGSLAKLGMQFLYSGHFERESGEPEPVTDNFDAPAAGSYTLRILNGANKTAVDSGHVFVNGVEVVTPESFKSHVRRQDFTVQLQASNTLKVQLEGKPGGQIFVLIVDSTGSVTSTAASSKK
jgi:hypothetical protein